MAKHNIDAIAHAVIAAHAAYQHHNQPTVDGPADTTPTPELLASVRMRVLEEIHGTPKEDDEDRSPEDRRTDRLFSGIVKALTVRL